MLPIVAYPLASFGIFALFSASFVFARAREREAASRRREARRVEWGRRREAASHDSATIERYHRAACAQRGDVDASVDAATWRDLDMDSVCAEIDRTITFAGAARLYDRLRSPSVAPAPLRRFDEVVTALSSDEPAREEIQSVLATSASPAQAAILDVLFGDVPSPPAARFAFPVLAALTLASLVASFALPAARFVLFAVAALSVVLRFRYGKDALASLEAFRRINQLLGLGRRLGALRVSAIEPELRALRETMNRLAPLERSTSWLLFDALHANEMLAIGVAYLNTFFLLDLIAVSFSLDVLRRNPGDVHALFAVAGDLDAAIAVASFRAGVARFTRPEIADDGAAIEIAGAVHPLVERAVPNGIRVEGRGVLLTGGNMSGKSTMARTIAVNALLAQTIYTALASRYRAPVLRVRTLMSAADDVRRNRSYYLAELEGAKALLAPSASGTRTLVILDELFRGTNTSERIGAGKAVLDALVQAGHFVFAATHDRELVELLAATFDAYHFGEDVVGRELVFPYDLRPGPAKTRNAIVLMRIAGFSDAVVGDANAVVEKIEGRGRLATSGPA